MCNFKIEIDWQRSTACAGNVVLPLSSPPMHGGPWYYDSATGGWTDKLPIATAGCAPIPQFKQFTVKL